MIEAKADPEGRLRTSTLAAPNGDADLTQAMKQRVLALSLQIRQVRFGIKPQVSRFLLAGKAFIFPNARGALLKCKATGRA